MNEIEMNIAKINIFFEWIIQSNDLSDTHLEMYS